MTELKKYLDLLETTQELITLHIKTALLDLQNDYLQNSKTLIESDLVCDHFEQFDIPKIQTDLDNGFEYFYNKKNERAAKSFYKSCEDHSALLFISPISDLLEEYEE